MLRSTSAVAEPRSVEGQYSQVFPLDGSGDQRQRALGLDQRVKEGCIFLSIVFIS